MVMTNDTWDSSPGTCTGTWCLSTGTGSGVGTDYLSTGYNSAVQTSKTHTQTQMWLNTLPATFTGGKKLYAFVPLQ